jgi:hypothetical protein
MNRLRRSALVLVPSIVVAALAAATAPPDASALGRPPERPNRPVCPGPIARGAAGCHARVITDRKGTPLAESSPSGYGPADFHGAYDLPTSSASPQTIAIVDAYDDPTIESDLAHYSETYGLPPCTTANGCFRKLNQSGQEGPYPKKDAGWALEIALDVETAHAICQNCEILLVEAESNQFSGETSDSSYNHPGIAITASAGDSGYGAEYPAASPYVVAVGGTTLTLGSSHSYGSETVWSGTGSGCSAYTSAPSWQTSDANWAQSGCGAKRGIADVAADADPNTGASVYDTTKYQGQEGWFTVGGTSLSAPLIAAVYALAGGGSVSYPASRPYGHQADSPASLHDVTTGSNGSCSTIMCKGAVGYDGPTGVGTPDGIAAFGEPGVDETPPETTITAGPSGPTNDATPSFSFSSSEPGSSFECRLDSGSFGACSSPYTAPTLSEGPHTFEVRASDEAANTDPSPATRSFTVDTEAPVSQASSPADTNSTTITVSYTASDAGSGLATLELWAEPPGSSSYAKVATDTSPEASGSFSYAAGAGDGSYAFYTRATDQAGNYEAALGSADSSTRLDTGVDTALPETTITPGPTGPAMQVAAPQAMAPAISIAVAAGRVRVFGDKALVWLRCRGAGPCRGVVKLSYRHRVRIVPHHHGHRTVKRRTGKILIGKLAFIVRSKKAIPIKLSNRGRSLLHNAHGHRLTVLLLGRGVKHRTVLLLQQPARRRPRG